LIETAPLTEPEMVRYSRHLLMPEVGLTGQQKLKSSSVLIVGLGGLGNPASAYLAAAGVGRIGLIDRDNIEESNLHRQVLYSEADVGASKVLTAARRLHEVNPLVKVEPHEMTLNSSNALDVLKDYDIVVDATDNFPARYLINDACVLLGKPDVYASIFRFDGQASVFYAKRGPCYRCLFPEPPPPNSVPSCADGGVLGVMPGIIGSIQAAQAISLILGMGEPLIGRLLVFTASDTSFNELRMRKNPRCAVCGPTPTITKLIDYDEFCGVTMGTLDFEVSPASLKREMDEGRNLVLIDVREPFEFQICRIEGAKLIPLSTLQSKIGGFGKDEDIVVYCHAGVRSARAAQMMIDSGFKKARSLRGGISAWAEQVEPGMPRY